MSRKEDNEKLIERLGNAMPDENSVRSIDIEAYQAAVLMDISKSLAIIADALAPKTPNTKPKEGNSTDNDSKWEI